MAIGIHERDREIFILYDDKRFEKGPLTYIDFPTKPTPESMNAALNYVDDVLLRFAPSTQVKLSLSGPPLPPTGSGQSYIKEVTISVLVQLRSTGATVLTVNLYYLCEAIQTRNLRVWTPVFLTQLKAAGIPFNLTLTSEDFSDLPAFRMF